MTTLEPEQKDILEKLNEIALEANWGTVERVDGTPKAIAIIQEAMEEIKRLREEESDLRLYETQMKDGVIDMKVGSENCDAFIWSILQMFKQNGGTNFVSTTITVDGKELGGRYALTIQKVGGLTPVEKARKEIDRLNCVIADLSETIKEYERELARRK